LGTDLSFGTTFSENMNVPTSALHNVRKEDDSDGEDEEDGMGSDTEDGSTEANASRKTRPEHQTDPLTLYLVRVMREVKDGKHDNSLRSGNFEVKPADPTHQLLNPRSRGSVTPNAYYLWPVYVWNPRKACAILG
jgi:hypothetical protein